MSAPPRRTKGLILLNASHAYVVLRVADDKDGRPGRLCRATVKRVEANAVAVGGVNQLPVQRALP